MSKKGTHGQCIFCPYVGRLHREDALPKWIGRALQKRVPPQGRWEALRIAVRSGETTRHHQRFVGNPSAVKLPVVCQERCNGGWMSRLEQAVRPILEPMIFDEPGSIDLVGQACLAAWLTKTALIHELIESDALVATDLDRRWFGEHREPFPLSHMLLARYVGTLAVVYHARRTILLRNPDDPAIPDQVYGQLFTLVIGRVVLQAIVPKRPTPTVGRFSREPGPFWVPLWPPSVAPISWPPPETLTDETLEAFTEVPNPRPTT